MRSVILASSLTAALSLTALAAQPGKPAPAQPNAPAEATEQKRSLSATNALGFVLQKGTEQSLETAQADSGRGWVITAGEAKFKVEQLARPGVDAKLRIDRFRPPEGTVVVQLPVTLKDRPEAFVKAMESADKGGAPLLIDTKGRKYSAIGFIYKDPSLVHIRYTPGTTLDKLNAAPTVGRSSPDRELTLLFSVTQGVEVKEFRVGTGAISTYDPPLKCDQSQK